VSLVLRALGAILSAATAASLTVAVLPASVRGRDAGRAPGRARVVQVVDGDTVVVDLGGSTFTVRLIGIDTPETVAPHRPVECYGPEASDRLKHLLPAGTPVRLWRDLEPRDRYDRVLAYVQRRPDGLFVNADQISSGAAIAKAFPPNTALRATFEQAQDRARAARLGLWGRCQ
jgi:endonuclease YncB( thermonuclease family)